MPKIINNVVKEATLRDVQSRVLAELSDILVKSFGPNGSNACLKKENAFSRYTKDGHSIIGAIQYNGIIEQSIKDDIESITRHIVKTVGDGTTSAVILSKLIFEKLRELESDHKYKPVEIVTALNNVVKYISEEIKTKATHLSMKDVYDIAMISTNGNETIANMLLNIYDEFGTSVYIDVNASTGEDMVIKSYDGMTLSCGYNNPCFITNKADNTAEVPNPEIYFFEHPIDTPELAIYLNAILSINIITPIKNNTFDKVIPTVIFAPKISQDLSDSMMSLTEYMSQLPPENKPPVCILTDYHEPEQLADLASLCGAKMIRKYIDPEIYKADVAAGRAPTPETISKWAGHCEKVISYSEKTKFINPALMNDKSGNRSVLYTNLVDFLKTEISRATSDGEDARTIGILKRRLHSLESNMVELYIGGITQADRDALRDLVEDAVLNLRSAAKNGVGLGANLTAFVSMKNITLVEDSLEGKILTALDDAYTKLVLTLFGGVISRSYNDEQTVENILEYAKTGIVFNIRTGDWGDNVKTSIMSDIVILDSVARIIGIMGTCNQFIVPSAGHNIYEFN